MWLKILAKKSEAEIKLFMQKVKTLRKMKTNTSLHKSQIQQA